MRTQFPRRWLNPGFLIPMVAVWFCLAVAPARATVTVEVFFDGGTLADGSLAILVADVNGNGFLPFTNPAVAGTVLSKGESIGGSDDVILAVLQADDGAHWNGSAGIAETVESLDYNEFGISAGTPLILYVFPYITQPGQVVASVDDVVTYRNAVPGGSGGDIAFVAPPDPGVYVLSALTAAQGGSFDPQNPTATETATQARSGIAGSAAIIDDHRNEADGGTPVTAGQTTGILSAGDVDFFSFNVTVPAQVIISTTGGTDTSGSLFDTGGNLLNDPVADGNRGGNANFRIETTITTPGTFDLSVSGGNGIAAGAYQLFVEIIPLKASPRPDVTIGKSPTTQKGDGTYNRSGAGQKLKQVSKKRKKLKFYFKVQNDSKFSHTISVITTPKDKEYKAKYFRISSPRQNVTAQMKRDAYQSTLAADREESFQLLVKPTRRAGRGKKTFTIDLESGTEQDRARAEARAK